MAEQIWGKVIDPARTFIIAEAGVNHNGDIRLAKQLIDVAAAAGADAVKFQTFKAENVAAVDAPKARYQNETTDKNQSQFDMLKNLELDRQAYQELQSYCAHQNIIFLSTAFDNESVDLLNDLNVNVFKIPSGEITNLPLLRRVAKTNKPVIISTGMASMNEIEDCVCVFGHTPFALLHCVSCYPADPEDVNLSAMKTMRDRFQVPVGYSDHTLGIDIALAAVALGACIIEKHFTLDKTMAGPDHKASVDPAELKRMVFSIRRIEQSLGDGLKHPVDAEMDNLRIVRRSIVLNEEVKKGQILKSDHLTTKRPASGISPMEWDRVVGTAAKRDFQKEENLEI